MKKQVLFNDRDQELISRIETYQKDNEIKSFVEAVRQLCRAGLPQSVSVTIDLKQKTKI